MTLLARFEKFCDIPPSPKCWIWTGRINRKYGQIKSEGRYERAHRVSYRLFRGEIPTGMCVLHHCDNPSCVNPSHLYLGTQSQNCQDRATRKRGKEHRQNGEFNDNAKLSERSVRKIEELVKSGITTQSVVARIFGVNQTQVSRIVHHKTWRHIWDE